MDPLPPTWAYESEGASSASVQYVSSAARFDVPRETLRWRPGSVNRSGGALRCAKHAEREETEGTEATELSQEKRRNGDSVPLISHTPSHTFLQSHALKFSPSCGALT